MSAVDFLVSLAFIAVAFLIAVLWADSQSPREGDDFTQSTHVRVLTDQEPTK